MRFKWYQIEMSFTGVQSRLMYAFELIAERRIEEAVAEGKFEHLERAGVPIDLSDYFSLPPELRLAWTVLRNANCLPEEVVLMKELEALNERLLTETSDSEATRIRRTIREKETSLQTALERSRARRT